MSMFAFIISLTPLVTSQLQIPTSQSLPALGLSLGSHWSIPTVSDLVPLLFSSRPQVWCCGRHSLGTLPTVPKLSSTTSCHRENRSGGVSLVLPCYFHMVMMDKALSTQGILAPPNMFAHSLIIVIFSARLERFLQLCDDHPDHFPAAELISRQEHLINMQVVNITSPANYFHCLRRQLHREWRKPLIVMSPKSLLRAPFCVSSISEFTSQEFKRLIPETDTLVADDKVLVPLYHPACHSPLLIGPKGCPELW